MPDKLPLTVEPRDRETAFSFLSRLACANGVSAIEFCADMGLKFRSILDGDGWTLNTVASLSGISSEQLRDWSPIRIGSRTHAFRGHRFLGTVVRNPTLRGCPVCLAVDAELDPDMPERAMAIRGDWLIPHVTLCIRHETPLVPLYTERSLDHRYDVAQHLRRHGPEILAQARVAERRTANDFDRWLDDRLAGRERDDWLADHPLHAAANFCRYLGRALHAAQVDNDDDKSWTEAEPWQLYRLGFDIARGGPTAIDRALRRVLATSVSPRAGPRKVYPHLHDRLAYDLASDPDYDPYRRVLRDHMRATWPLGPGDEILGEPVAERKLHSISTAAQETGIDKRRLRKIVTEAGLLADTSLPDAWAVFDAHMAAPLIDAAAQLIDAKAFAEVLGASRSQFELLAEDEIVRPAKAGQGLKAVWDPKDARALLDTLFRNAVPIRYAKGNWTQISESARRLRIGPGRIVEAIIDSRLRRTAKLTGKTGYAAVFVDHREAQQLFENKQVSGWTLEEFARVAGIRPYSALTRLIADGHTPATELQNPVLRVSQRYMTKGDREAFADRFCTVSTIGKFYQRSWQSVSADLGRHDIPPFQDQGRRYGNIYLWADVRTVIRRR